MIEEKFFYLLVVLIVFKLDLNKYMISFLIIIFGLIHYQETHFACLTFQSVFQVIKDIKKTADYLNDLNIISENNEHERLDYQLLFYSNYNKLNRRADSMEYVF